MNYHHLTGTEWSTRLNALRDRLERTNDSLAAYDRKLTSLKKLASKYGQVGRACPKSLVESIRRTRLERVALANQYYELRQKIASVEAGVSDP
jgi:predicted DNA-binding protein YlxM (UPF0122 family)